MHLIQHHQLRLPHARGGLTQFLPALLDPGVAGEAAEQLPLHRHPGGGGNLPPRVEVQAAEGADGGQVLGLLNLDLQLVEMEKRAELPQVGAVGQGGPAELLLDSGHERAGSRGCQQLRVDRAVGLLRGEPQRAQITLQRNRLQRVFAHRHQQRTVRGVHLLPDPPLLRLQVRELHLQPQQLVVGGEPLAVARLRVAQGLLQAADALRGQPFLFAGQQGVEVALPNLVHQRMGRATQLFAAQPLAALRRVQPAERRHVQHGLVEPQRSRHGVVEGRGAGPGLIAITEGAQVGGFRQDLGIHAAVRFTGALLGDPDGRPRGLQQGAVGQRPLHRGAQRQDAGRLAMAGGRGEPQQNGRCEGTGNPRRRLPGAGGSAGAGVRTDEGVQRCFSHWVSARGTKNQTARARYRPVDRHADRRIYSRREARR